MNKISIRKETYEGVTALPHFPVAIDYEGCHVEIEDVYFENSGALAHLFEEFEVWPMDFPPLTACCAVVFRARGPLMPDSMRGWFMQIFVRRPDEWTDVGQWIESITCFCAV